MNIKPFISACLLAALPFAVNHAKASGKHKNIKQIHYEVWASDQSNSVSGATAPGTEGSFLWIWDSKDINRQVAGGRDAKPLACGPKRKHTRHKGRNVGPCDLWDVFPHHLVEVDADGYPTGNRLSDLNGFGRLHGMLSDPQKVTVNGKYIHNVDRIRNVVEVFSNDYPSRIGTYDLVSRNGKGRGNGPCAYKSVDDDPLMSGNDPAPDLLERTPDGKYLMVAFRGPSPVSVGHSAQGSCPGVGIVKLRNGGASGKLVGVLRTTNTVDTTAAGAPGGHAYNGQERSDVHAATVVRKN